MRTRSLVAVLALTVVVALACDDDLTLPQGVEVFTATLNGANERPNPVDTDATGTAVFTAIEDLISWRVDVASIDNVTIGHIHAGGPEEAGGIIVNLQPETTGPNFTGTVALGSATVVDSVLTRMRNGTAYVNIHTQQNPPGEIRGQIRRVQ